MLTVSRVYSPTGLRANRLTGSTSLQAYRRTVQLYRLAGNPPQFNEKIAAVPLQRCARTGCDRNVVADWTTCSQECHSSTFGLWSTWHPSRRLKSELGPGSCCHQDPTSIPIAPFSYFIVPASAYPCSAPYGDFLSNSEFYLQSGPGSTLHPCRIEVRSVTHAVV